MPTNETAEQVFNGGRPIVVVGAGMAGLSCALHLHEAGLPVQVFESSDGVGGRVRTDLVDGFRLDRGFQVYLDAYVETGKLLNLEALDLRKFEPGALVYKDGKLYRLMDVFRRPGAIFESLKAPIGSFSDKVRVGLMRTKILSSSLEKIANRRDRTTETYLRECGFSDSMIDVFFRSFYGGIFLERELRTSSRMFEFTFKMFGRGSATLPAKGIGEIPKQLASRLPAGCVQLDQMVTNVGAKQVTLGSGEQISAAHVVIATDTSCAQRLVPSAHLPKPKWRSVTNLYFAAERSPINEAIICLNGGDGGIVNNVCVLTDASEAYSGDGRALLSVSVLGLHTDDGLTAKVQAELVGWFGSDVEGWAHLRTDRIKKALPEQPPSDPPKDQFLHHSGVYFCGDHCTSASIEGAVISGKRVAAAILSANAGA